MLEGIVVGSLSPGVLLLYFGIVLISWGYLNSLSLFMNRPVRYTTSSPVEITRRFSNFKNFISSLSSNKFDMGNGQLTHAFVFLGRNTSGQLQLPDVGKMVQHARLLAAGKIYHNQGLQGG
jgi:hypothetical protein